MQVHLELYAALMRYLPPGADRHRVTVDIEPGATAHDLLDRYKVPREQAHLVLRNGVFLQPAERDGLALAEGDLVAAWPPVAGG
ncbi:MAG: MoaD/ThiS family protein [Chromatiaceae bacterium]|nr:MoaD/ThiS family protein [Gammaproteobacteria bacterium]MCP5313512.1 MoaD/ThiS family protein [Chromatiaceae bacterium]